MLYRKPIFREMFLSDRVKETQWCVRQPVHRLHPVKVRQQVNFDQPDRDYVKILSKGHYSYGKYTYSMVYHKIGVTVSKINAAPTIPPLQSWKKHFHPS